MVGMQADTPQLGVEHDFLGDGATGESEATPMSAV
jgi:hypothetical protein